jgi:hypothetical protein
MLISATHTHSAPACGGALGTPADPGYVRFMIPRVARAIEKAVANLEPARVGAAVVDAGAFTAVRRWVRRPDRMLTDPFGRRSVRANMHPGPNSRDTTGPSGPEDPDLSVLAVHSKQGRPSALLANFANHYVGAPAVGADYFGVFAERLEQRLAPDQDDAHPPFVGMMSQGTSGDVWLLDYFHPGPVRRPGISEYANRLVERAVEAYRSISFRDDVTLSMVETEVPLKYRVPDAQRLAWARRMVSEMGERLPASKPEVYAKEALLLHEKKSTRILLQAIRIGDIGLTGSPNEVYALTGLKLKALSPLQPTINIELANGAEGYIPPPEQHALGGYNTWPARSAGLEVEAEPKIAEALTKLLETVSGKTRRSVHPTAGPAARSVLASDPLVYWRLDEWAAPRAGDLVGSRHGRFEPGVVFYLEGPCAEAFNAPGEINRCPHFAGGRMRAAVEPLGTAYSVSLWCWNGMVTDARAVTGYLFSRGPDGAARAPGDHLGIGGTYREELPGRLFFFNGNEKNEVLTGRTRLERWTWHHVVLVRDGEKVRVHVNGNREPEIEGRATVSMPPDTRDVFIGGRNDNFANFEGRIDEVAVFNRALTPEEVFRQYRATHAEPSGLANARVDEPLYGGGP